MKSALYCVLLPVVERKKVQVAVISRLNVVLLRPYVFGSSKGVSFVCEGIYMRMKNGG